VYNILVEEAENNNILGVKPRRREVYLKVIGSEGMGWMFQAYNDPVANIVYTVINLRIS
jgi:hypothetical protein